MSGWSGAWKRGTYPNKTAMSNEKVPHLHEMADVSQKMSEKPGLLARNVAQNAKFPTSSTIGQSIARQA
jgi:hypothetical protein